MIGTRDHPRTGSDDLRPVAIGQSQIQNDEVDIPRARKVSESRRSRGCLARTIAVHVKGTRNQIAHRRVILHNEDNALGLYRSSSALPSSDDANRDLFAQLCRGKSEREHATVRIGIAQHDITAVRP